MGDNEVVDDIPSSSSVDIPLNNDYNQPQVRAARSPCCETYENFSIEQQMLLDGTVPLPTSASGMTAPEYVMNREYKYKNRSFFNQSVSGSKSMMPVYGRYTPDMTMYNVFPASDVQSDVLIAYHLINNCDENGNESENELTEQDLVPMDTCAKFLVYVKDAAENIQKSRRHSGKVELVNMPVPANTVSSEVLMDKITEILEGEFDDQLQQSSSGKNTNSNCLSGNQPKKLSEAHSGGSEIFGKEDEGNASKKEMEVKLKKLDKSHTSIHEKLEEMEDEEEEMEESFANSLTQQIAREAVRSFCCIGSGMSEKCLELTRRLSAEIDMPFNPRCGHEFVSRNHYYPLKAKILERDVLIRLRAYKHKYRSSSDIMFCPDLDPIISIAPKLAEVTYITFVKDVYRVLRPFLAARTATVCPIFVTLLHENVTVRDIWDVVSREGKVGEHVRFLLKIGANTNHIMRPDRWREIEVKWNFYKEMVETSSKFWFHSKFLRLFGNIDVDVPDISFEEWWAELCQNGTLIYQKTESVDEENEDGQQKHSTTEKFVENRKYSEKISCVRSKRIACKRRQTEMGEAYKEAEKNEGTSDNADKALKISSNLQKAIEGFNISSSALQAKADHFVKRSEDGQGSNQKPKSVRSRRPNPDEMLLIENMENNALCYEEYQVKNSAKNEQPDENTNNVPSRRRAIRKRRTFSPSPNFNVNKMIKLDDENEDGSEDEMDDTRSDSDYSEPTPQSRRSAAKNKKANLLNEHLKQNSAVVKTTLSRQPPPLGVKMPSGSEHSSKMQWDLLVSMDKNPLHNNWQTWYNEVTAQCLTNSSNDCSLVNNQNLPKEGSETRNTTVDSSITSHTIPPILTPYRNQGTNNDSVETKAVSYVVGKPKINGDVSNAVSTRWTRAPPPRQMNHKNLEEFTQASNIEPGCISLPVPLVLDVLFRMHAIDQYSEATVQLKRNIAERMCDAEVVSLLNRSDAHSLVGELFILKAAENNKK